MRARYLSRLPVEPDPPHFAISVAPTWRGSVTVTVTVPSTSRRTDEELVALAAQVEAGLREQIGDAVTSVRVVRADPMSPNLTVTVRHPVTSNILR